jgi:transcriptional regulator with XRE-family HTH domain
MAHGPRSRSPGLQYLYDRYIGDDPKKIADFETAKSNAEVAQAIYNLRTGAGLSQKQLAELVGTTPSVICRLEDADYTGHSLSMLTRVAAAVGHRVMIWFSKNATKKVKAKPKALAKKDALTKAALIKVAPAKKDTLMKRAPVKKAAAKKVVAAKKAAPAKKDASPKKPKVPSVRKVPK